MSALWKAMLEAQKEIKNAVKDSKNPHFKNDYASLESVINATVPIYNKHGLVVTQLVHGLEAANGVAFISTEITHAESGESFKDQLPIPLAKNDPQGMGSAITYGRRYGLQAISCTASEDDDGEQAVVNKNIPPAPIVKFGGAAEKAAKPEAKSADPVAVTAMTNKLNSALGFKKSNG